MHERKLHELRITWSKQYTAYLVEDTAGAGALRRAAGTAVARGSLVVVGTGLAADFHKVLAADTRLQGSLTSGCEHKTHARARMHTRARTHSEACDASTISDRCPDGERGQDCHAPDHTHPTSKLQSPVKHQAASTGQRGGRAREYYVEGHSLLQGWIQ